MKGANVNIIFYLRKKPCTIMRPHGILEAVRNLFLFPLTFPLISELFFVNFFVKNFFLLILLIYFFMLIKVSLYANDNQKNKLIKVYHQPLIGM